MRIYIFILFLVQFSLCYSQFTHSDSIRGSITPERAWWNLTHYDLFVKVYPNEQEISGSNTISFEVIDHQQEFQIDLQHPLILDSVIFDNQQFSFRKDGDNAYYIQLPSKFEIGTNYSLTAYYHGIPRVAKRAPWDGGIVWKSDKNGNPIIATACQGLGASVWWPCKDHMYDEPEHGMNIAVNSPDEVMDVSNGRLITNELLSDGTRTTHWEVVNPINNYGVNMNVADYVHWHEIYNGEKGPLDLDFYVYPQNLEAAKIHFQDAHRVLEALEYWFGPYPFYEDGYKLVEVPYLGMEHQSSVTYGNNYKKGYLGTDLSGTGWGMKWDYIIIHESGHEWFANNITYKDNADMWIHEGFTTYSEGLFTEYFYGKEAGFEYQRGLRKNISNDKPIIGQYDVNQEGSGDMYPKGANMLHTIRQIIDNDSLWRQILRGLNEEFYHQTVTTEQIESYITLHSGIDLQTVFDQYLRTSHPPELIIVKKRKKVTYYWGETVPDLKMPIDVICDGEKIRIYPSNEKSTIKARKFSVSPDFYLK